MTGDWAEPIVKKEKGATCNLCWFEDGSHGQTCLRYFPKSHYTIPTAWEEPPVEKK